ncbi:STY46, partial [Symbiodinium sp. CCMP2456]
MAHSNRSAYGPFDEELVGPKITDSTAEDAEELAMSAMKSWASSCTEKSCAERHSMLSLRGQESRWMIPRKELQLQLELSRTLKSTLYRASWHGTEVVVKCAGRHDNDAAEAVLNAGTRKTGSSPEETETTEIAAELLHEIDVLSSMRHPDMVMFIGACLDPQLPIMCVTEFMPGGDLESYYSSQRNKHDCAVWSPRLSTVLEWSSAVVRALVFLHSRKMVHRDLKPMNLLLNKHQEVKVSDFGISRMLSLSDAYSMTGGIGSWRYMAPEVVRHQAYDEKVDIYALGLIIYFMSSL